MSRSPDDRRRTTATTAAVAARQATTAQRRGADHVRVQASNAQATRAGANIRRSLNLTTCRSQVGTSACASPPPGRDRTAVSVPRDVTG